MGGQFTVNIGPPVASYCSSFQNGIQTQGGIAVGMYSLFFASNGMENRERLACITALRSHA